jgi:hypothetical protein
VRFTRLFIYTHTIKKDFIPVCGVGRVKFTFYIFYSSHRTLSRCERRANIKNELILAPRQQIMANNFNRLKSTYTVRTVRLEIFEGALSIRPGTMAVPAPAARTALLIGPA